ncbi:ABC transporter substrate-binding protein [Paenibacillus aurantius]|uniref:ABC transporter substrate-binding protein n=1 Tax=Paenibacillus aurantius TaxID=2918900 RepID=A0AA96LDP4_9BACL|nr:ABC transporter substrate-binding protein [Paenibacillus aurantius]WNQ10235.1 ABC transporter substrate-binding protein [Paenibacillus aurantius]
MAKTAKWFKRMGTGALGLVLAASLAACGSGKEGTGAATSSTQPTAQSSASPGASSPAASPKTGQTAYPLTIKDATGTDVVFEKAPERVTTLVPSETEIVFAIGAGDKIAGVDKFSDYPAEAKSKPQIGDMNANLEALLATKPDLVLASASMNKKTVDQLRELKIKVFASDPKTVDEVMDKITTVGKIMNMADGAKKVTDKMREEKQKVTDAVKNAPKKKVYMEFSPGWTVGKGEFMDELVSLAGGDNVAHEQAGWNKIDPEKIIKSNPEVILYAKGESGMSSILDEIKKRPGFEAIDAMKNNKVYAIDSNKVARVGPRLTEALTDMAKAIHPDLVK